MRVFRILSFLTFVAVSTNPWGGCEKRGCGAENSRLHTVGSAWSSCVQVGPGSRALGVLCSDGAASHGLPSPTGSKGLMVRRGLTRLRGGASEDPSDEVSQESDDFLKRAAQEMHKNGLGHEDIVSDFLNMSKHPDLMSALANSDAGLQEQHAEIFDDVDPLKFLPRDQSQENQLREQLHKSAYKYHFGELPTTDVEEEQENPERFPDAIAEERALDSLDRIREKVEGITVKVPKPLFQKDLFPHKKNDGTAPQKRSFEDLEAEEDSSAEDNVDSEPEEDEKQEKEDEKRGAIGLSADDDGFEDMDDEADGDRSASKQGPLNKLGLTGSQMETVYSRDPRNVTVLGKRGPAQGTLDAKPSKRVLIDEDEDIDLVPPDAPEPEDIVVPDTYNNVPEAVLVAHDPWYSARIFLRSGEHTWVGYNYGRIEVLKPLEIIAQDNALLRGRWVMLEGSSGTFKHARCLWESICTSEERVLLEPVVYVKGGKPWNFENCDIRSSGSIAVLVTMQGDATFQYCTLGGPAVRRYEMEYDEKYCASTGIETLGEAWVVLRHCKIQDVYGMGTSFYGTTHGYLEATLFERVGIGLGIDRDAKVILKDCTFSETEEAAFWMMEGVDEFAEAELDGNVVYGFVWATNKRPPKLTLRRNNFNDTFPDQWMMLAESKAPQVFERIARGLPWIQVEHPLGVVPRASNFPY